MTLLISFVNQNLTPQLKLGIYNNRSKKFQVVPIMKDIMVGGITGLQYDNKNHLLYFALQNGQIGICKLGFEVIQLFETKLVKDPHSLLLKDNILYCVSTGTNLVVALNLDEKGFIVDETEIFTIIDLKNKDVDILHFNCICDSNEGVLLSFFGNFRNVENVPEAYQKGGILNINSGEVVMSNLLEPHSCFSLKNGLYILESSRSRLLNKEGNELYKGKGYLRGLLRDGNKLYVGSSNRRTKLSGLTLHQNWKLGPYEDSEHNCELIICEIKEDGIEIKDKIRISPFANEIYDIIKIPQSWWTKVKNKDNNYNYEHHIQILGANYIELLLSFNEKIKNAATKGSTEMESLVKQIQANRKLLNKANKLLQKQMSELGADEALKKFEMLNEQMRKKDSLIINKNTIIFEKNSYIRKLEELNRQKAEKLKMIKEVLDNSKAKGIITDAK